MECTKFPHITDKLVRNTIKQKAGWVLILSIDRWVFFFPLREMDDNLLCRKFPPNIVLVSLEETID